MKHPKVTVHCVYDSPLGPMVLAASAAKLLGVWFTGQKHQPDPCNWPLAPHDPVLLQAQTQLGEYFDGKRSTFDLPLDLRCGTSFEQKVWRALRLIPWGGTLSYGQLGASIGQPTAARAVGAAVGRNPWCIVVPCHRVLGAGGALTGYAAGIDRKKALLKLEDAALPPDRSLV